MLCSSHHRSASKERMVEQSANIFVLSINQRDIPVPLVMEEILAVVHEEEKLVHRIECNSRALIM